MLERLGDNRRLANRNFPPMPSSTRPTSMRFIFRLASLFLVCTISLNSIRADILTTRFFSGQIIRYTEDGTASTFANISSGTDPFPGLSSVAVDEVNNRVYASGFVSNRIYELDATTGAILNTANGQSSASGLTVRNGLLYASTSSGINVFGPGLVSQTGFTLAGGPSSPSGLGFSGDNLIVSSIGAGVFSLNINTSTWSHLSTNDFANSQVAVASDGTMYVGSGDSSSSSLFHIAANGGALGSIVLDDSALPQPAFPYASDDFTNPSGVYIDANGNLVVSALGRTNPFSPADNFQNNGGLFRYNLGTSTWTAIATQTTPYSSVAFISAVPEPGSLLVLSIATGAVALRSRRKRMSKRTSTAGTL
jgi:hypothetical protein